MNSPINFVPNPYVVGGSMREDVFSVQLSIEVELEIGILDNDRVSTYTQKSNHFLDSAATVSCAVELINQFLKKHSERGALDEIAREYIDPIEDRLEWSSPLSVRIYDRENRLIIGGTVVNRSSVNWMMPVIKKSERERVKKLIDDLQSEASFEHGWDNYSTAKSLWNKAEHLKWTLSSSPIVSTPFFAEELVKMGVSPQNNFI